MADNLSVEGIASLYAVDDLAFLVVADTGNHGNSLHVISGEVFVLGINLLNAQALQRLDEFLVNELHAFFYGLRIIVVVGQGALKIIEDRKNGRNGLLTAVENQFSLFLQGTLLVVVEFCNCTQITVLKVVDLLLELLFL